MPIVTPTDLYETKRAVLTYFVERYGLDWNHVSLSMDLKEYLGMSDAQWAGIALGLSAESWMKALRVRLSTTEMGGKNSAEALGALIWKKHTAPMPTSPKVTVAKATAEAKAKKKPAGKK